MCTAALFLARKYGILEGMKVFAKAALYVAAACLTVTGCASGKKTPAAKVLPPEETLIPMQRVTIPAAAYEEAAGLGGTNVFTESEIVMWNAQSPLSGRKIYIKNPRKFGDQSVSLVHVGNGKKILRTEFNLGTEDTHYGLLFNTAGSRAYCDLRRCVLTVRLYVSDYLTLMNPPFTPRLSFIAYYGSSTPGEWRLEDFDGELSAFSFADIGSGWQEISLNFAAGTYTMGKKSGTFSVPAEALERNTMVGIDILGKKLNSAINIPLLIERVEITLAE